MNKHRIFGVVSVVFLASVMIFSAVYFWGGPSNSGSTTGYFNESELASINVSSAGVYVSDSNSTIFVNGSSNLPVMMGPMNAPSMHSFEILGILNPEIMIRQGSDVHFTII